MTEKKTLVGDDGALVGATRSYLDSAGTARALPENTALGQLVAGTAAAGVGRRDRLQRAVRPGLPVVDRRPARARRQGLLGLLRRQRAGPGRRGAAHPEEGPGDRLGARPRLREEGAVLPRPRRDPGGPRPHHVPRHARGRRQAGPGQGRDADHQRRALPRARQRPRSRSTPRATGPPARRSRARSAPSSSRGRLSGAPGWRSAAASHSSSPRSPSSRRRAAASARSRIRPTSRPRPPAPRPRPRRPRARARRPPHASPAATLLVTEDFGRVERTALAVAPEQSVLSALRSVTEVDTTYGGRYVQGIDGLEGSLERARDWLFFVNGIESPLGADDVRVHDGDHIWWDYRRWRNYLHVPVVVGAWPEPFLHGEGGRVPIVSADPPLDDALRALGADVRSLAPAYRVVGRQRRRAAQARGRLAARGGPPAARGPDDVAAGRPRARLGRRRGQGRGRPAGTGHRRGRHGAPGSGRGRRAGRRRRRRRGGPGGGAAHRRATPASCSAATRVAFDAQGEPVAAGGLGAGL